MKFDQVKRKSNRLAGYDYSQNGAYFITMCAKDRSEIFSTILANCVRPNGFEKNR
jgi:hypothetical protein